MNINKLKKHVTLKNPRHKTILNIQYEISFRMLLVFFHH